jgi:hypothetical protein
LSSKVIESNVANLIRSVQASVSTDLIKPRFRTSHRLGGACYIVSEALYHLLGGRGSGYKPMIVKVRGITHWWLVDDRGTVIDGTAEQFSEPVDYSKGKGCGFLTLQPSKRAQVLIERMRL